MIERNMKNNDRKKHVKKDDRKNDRKKHVKRIIIKLSIRI